MTRKSTPSHFRVMHDLVGSAYFPVSALARLPMSMLVLGVLTYVVGASSDFAAGGIAAAITGLGVALGAPLSGIASDRRGQRLTLLVASVVYVVAVGAVLLAGSRIDADGGLSPALLAAAFAAGVVVPQCGPMTRVRWIRGLSARGSARAVGEAQGYESTMDELGFVLGPALVGVVATVFGPAAPLYVVCALTVIVVPWFALHPSERFAAPLRRTTAATAGATVEDTPAEDADRISWALISVLTLGMLAVGTIFGSLANATTVFADETGHAGSGGLIYAAMGLTSGAAALSVSRWSPRLTPAVRWLGCAVVLMPALILLWAPTVPWQMAAVLLLVGAPIGPVLVTIFKVAGDHTPVRRLGFIMTLLSAGITLGTALGNYSGGLIANTGGYSAVIWVSVGAGLVLVASAMVVAAGRFTTSPVPPHSPTPRVLETAGARPSS